MSKLIKLDIELLIEKYEQGLSTRELADTFNVHPSTIQDRLRKLNKIRKRGRRRIYSESERKDRRRCNDKTYNASVAAKLAHRRRCKRDKQKVRARWTVENNIRSGKILRINVQSCFDCGNQANEYDHYLGYKEEHMLSIQPVCYPCHRSRKKIRGF